MDITNEEIKRVPQVLGNKLTFKEVTEVIAKPAESKAPKWWFIGLFASISLTIIGSDDRIFGMGWCRSLGIK